MLKPFNSNVYLVILAGGSGTRFWPKSRTKTPKQLCKIGTNSKTMIELTLDRLYGLIPPERTLIVTHKDQIDLTRKIVGAAACHYIGEPDARNTAAALALASLEIEHLHKEDKKPVMISLHADHMIEKVEEFINKLHDAVEMAEAGHLNLIELNLATQRQATVILKRLMQSMG